MSWVTCPPIDKFGADCLFQIISHRYERGATLITTNRVYKNWASIFNNDAVLTSALLDRVSHHAQQANAVTLATRLIDAGIVPMTEPEDATHIALATLSQATYLVTWNFSHFVGPDAKFKVFGALRDWGYTPPLFATPEELLEGAQP